MMTEERSAHVEEMLDTIVNECALCASMTGRSGISNRVLDAMARVPRERFVPEAVRPLAYANRALPIDHGQTISQPFIVALMTDLLNLKKNDRVLEIGTGSGYQAAVLSLLVKEVYTIDIVPPLIEEAAERMAKLGYKNVSLRCGDGYTGWSEHAPFDAIMITAAAPRPPQPVVEQLKPGGRMVLPVGLPFQSQELMLIRKDEGGRTDIRKILDVAFVPLVGEGGIKGLQ